MNLETITLSLTNNFLTRFNIPLYSKILDISIREYSLIVLIMKEDMLTSAYKGVDIFCTSDLSYNSFSPNNLPYWGSRSKNEIILTSSNGNNIDIKNNTSLYYIFLKEEESLEEKRNEKLKQIIKN